MEWSVSFQWGGSAVDGTKRGRPMSAETKVFREACEKFMESSHRALRRDDVKAILIKLNTNECSNNTISERSVARYFQFHS
jgi:hypothetical protein